jgi:phage antirepressor YoqD-like protein
VDFYRLPRRESLLIALNYSVKAQELTLDYWERQAIAGPGAAPAHAPVKTVPLIRTDEANRVIASLLATEPQAFKIAPITAAKLDKPSPITALTINTVNTVNTVSTISTVPTSLDVPGKAGEVTMSSLELVEFINASRAPGDADLRHDHFMAKVPMVLGGDAPKFRGVYTGGNGQMRPCYRFPKREACLMAMSYSYELQAKVFDRMTELEAKATPAATPTPITPAFTVPQTMGQALALAAQQWELAEVATAQVKQLSAEAAIAAPKVAVHDAVMADREMTLRVVYRQVNPNLHVNQASADLRRLGYLYKEQGTGVNRIYRRGKNLTYFAEKRNPATGACCIEVTAAGLALLRLSLSPLKAPP